MLVTAINRDKVYIRNTIRLENYDRKILGGTLWNSF